MTRQDITPYSSTLSSKAIGTPYRDKVYNVSERFLSTAVKTGWVSLGGAEVVLIKSTKGTGKTEVLGDFVKSLPDEMSVIQIGHRRSLSKSLSDRLHLTSYLDTDRLSHRFSLSIDSLIRINPQHARPYDVVIIDESEQVFRHLVGDTTERKREQIFSTLRWLIYHAKKVICSDADMTGELTVELIGRLRRDIVQDRVKLIFNEWEVGRTINVYESKQHALAQLAIAVSEGKRVYVPVGEKGLALQIEALLRALRRPNDEVVKVLTLIGPNSDTQQAIDFFANPNAEAVKYDVVIATSTLSTGVSIDVKWFDAVYGLFDGSVYTYQDCDQAISRVRKCDSVNVWVHAGRPPRFQSEGQMRANYVNKEQSTRRHFLPDDVATLSSAEELYLDAETRIRWCEQQWSFDRTNKFIDLKKADGWIVNWIESDQAEHDAGREMLKIGRDPNGERPYRPILKAENLSDEEFEQIKDVQGLSNAKKNAVNKYRVAKVFGLLSPADVQMHHLKQYYQDDVRGKVRNLKLLAASEADALRWDQNERENPEGKAFTSFDHRYVRQELMNGALKASGIDPADVWSRANRQTDLLRDLADAKSALKPKSRPHRAATSRFTEESEANAIVVGEDQLRLVTEYVDRHLEKINMFLETRFVRSSLAENQVQVFNKVLGECGVAIKREQKKGEKRLVVDYEKVSELAKSQELLAVVCKIGLK
ncbi:plasmid replication protein, CyRepA1 family [Ralstonia pseudosolanacearum]|uniref:plasmid replication protein, CyRepA1 family n=1 Tax=Ralstonia pseudosolanacearum TaxID=1310165 RepID=UPI000B2DDAFA|nr:plasmid replication protein, CyRepA1 family [Ralstonia pseudosolanacearum]